EDVEVARVVVCEEVDRRRQYDPVAERDAADAERGRERDDEGDRALAMLLEGRREEGPELPEDDREREQEGRVEGHQERGRGRRGLVPGAGRQLWLLVLTADRVLELSHALPERAADLR